MKNMKNKIAAFLLASAVSAGMFQAIPASAAERSRLMGDLDGDGKITAIDAQLTLTIYAEALVELVDNAANAENGSGDINMNGVIDASDAQSILCYYCQTLVGDQPLWAEFRDISYHNITEHDGMGTVTDETDLQYILRGMYLEIGCAQGAPGETVEVPVYLAGVDDLAGFQIFLEADEGLDLTRITSDLAPNQDEYENDPEAYMEQVLSGAYPVVTNPEYGALVWVSAKQFDPRDGLVIGRYHYVIPEDAESGTVYRVGLNNEERTKFVPRECEYSYEFTLLEGAVVVE